MCNGVAQLNRWPVQYWVLLPGLVTVTELLSSHHDSHNTQGDDAGINDFSSSATRGHTSLFAESIKV